MEIGTPDFGIIDVKPAEEIANALQAYVEIGSKITGVAIDSIDTALSRDMKVEDHTTVTELVAHGCKRFDALVWFSAKSHGQQRSFQSIVLTE